MADSAVIIGVTAVLTSGVLGPLVMHHAQKDRDTLADMRATLDAAVEPLAKALAQSAWLHAWAFGRGADAAEVERRAEDLVHQTLLVEAHGVKLEIRFPRSELAKAYMAAGGAVREKASLFWRRRQGEFETLAEVKDEMREADKIYLDAYKRFIAEASKWNAGSQWPGGAPHP